MDTNEYLYPALKVERKTGDEPFIGSDASFRLADFWGWAYSDLVGNTERGKFAEFIVSMAMHCTDGVSDGWGAFDVLSPEGIKIEVKTSAYLQSWGQNRISDIRFGVQETLAWDAVTNVYAETAARQADIYVFCVENCKEQDLLNPLDLLQWDFYSIATEVLNKAISKQKSIGLNTLINLGAKKCGYAELRRTILVLTKVKLTECLSRANHPSLNQARANWKQYGAIEADDKP
jgi:hypothetical protein